MHGLDYYGSMQRPLRLLCLALVASFGSVAGVALAQTPETPPVKNSNLSAETFYQLLIGEISANNGDGSNAYALMLNAANMNNSAQLYERAVELALRGRSGDLALQAAQAWAKAQPGSREANRYLIQIYIGLNRVTDTMEPIRRDLKSLNTADKITAIGQLPRYFARASDKRQAATTVEQALALELTQSTTGPAAWAAIGGLRLMANDREGALEAARQGAALNRRAEDPAWLAMALMDPRLPAAEALIQTYLSDKVSPELRMGYIRKLLDLARYLEAGVQVMALTKEHPAYANGWLVRGSLELQERQLSKAEESLKSYLELAKTEPRAEPETAPDTPRGVVQAYLMLAQIAEQSNRLEEANSYLQRIDNPQESLRVQIRQAGILARQNKLEEARALVRNAPELQEEDARTKLSAELQLLRDYKLYEQAYQVLLQANERFTADVDFLYEQAMMAEKLDKHVDMERLLREVIAIKPDYHQAYNALGYSLADRNVRLTEARELVKKALFFAPDDPFIIDSMAWVEFRSGNLEEALRLLQVAYRARPDAEIAAHLGEVLWSLQRQELARSIWKEGLALNPTNETLLETMQRLGRKP